MKSSKQSSFRKDLTGQRFGMLVVQAFSGKKHYWNCKCDCGNIHTAMSSNLKAGHVRSCGCSSGEWIRQSRIRHGQFTHGKPTTEYKIWESIKQRCQNPKNPAYDRYGGRGITLCERWQDFVNFYADMGKRPDGRSIDRIDNEKGYSPENCRWATRKQQQNNKRSSIRIPYRGEYRTASEWSDITGLPRTLILGRFKRGVTGDQIFSHAHL